MRHPVMWVWWLRHPVYWSQSIKTVKRFMPPQCSAASAPFIPTIPLRQNRPWTTRARGGWCTETTIIRSHTYCWLNSTPKSQFEEIISFINCLFIFLYCSQSSFVLQIPPCQKGNPQNTTQVHQSRNSLGDPVISHRRMLCSCLAVSTGTQLGQRPMHLPHSAAQPWGATAEQSPGDRRGARQEAIQSPSPVDKEGLAKQEGSGYGWAMTRTATRAWRLKGQRVECPMGTSTARSNLGLYNRSGIFYFTFLLSWIKSWSSACYQHLKASMSMQPYLTRVAS